MQIKEKISKLGIPLTDWEIDINYGIKTGYNEAFILSGTQRDELIKADPKSAEIIRPILRGRDIGKYSYNFNDLFLIATFPSKRYNIDDFPAIKQYLLGFGYDRLKQTGGAGARKRTNNAWFETQDSIGYWEDFSKQKIVWKRIGSILRFSFDDKGLLALDSTCFACGKSIKFLVGVLNSKMGHYLMKDSPKTGTGDLIVSVQAIEPLKVPKPDQQSIEKIEQLVGQILANAGQDCSELITEIDRVIYSLYNLSDEEIQFIESR